MEFRYSILIGYKNGTSLFLYHLARITTKRNDQTTGKSAPAWAQHPDETLILAIELPFSSLGR